MVELSTDADFTDTTNSALFLTTWYAHKQVGTVNSYAFCSAVGNIFFRRISMVYDPQFSHSRSSVLTRHQLLHCDRILIRIPMDEFLTD